MDTFGAYEAKVHLPQLLKRVEKGEKIVITRHGVPIALLQPVHPCPGSSVAETIEELKAFRAQHRLDGLSIREMIEEGRR